MSKEKIISLEDAVQQGLIKVEDYIDYRPTYGKYQPTKNLTGISARENPYFETENFGWKLDNIDGKMLLVADNATKEQLGLYGETGYYHATKVLNKITKTCYTDPMLADKVESITRDIYKKLSPCNVLISDSLEYWVAAFFKHSYPYYSSFYGMERKYYGFGLYRIYRDDWLAATLFQIYDSGEYYGKYSEYYSVRPVVFLKSNIQMVLSEESNGTKKKPWKTLRAETNSTAETATANKEETESVVKKELPEEVDSAKREKETLQDLLQQAEKEAAEVAKSGKRLDEMIQTIKEILNS